VAKDKRFVQVLMASGSNRLFGRSFSSIYEAAERNGLPSRFIPAPRRRQLRRAHSAGYPSRYMEWHNILPINYMATINSLVCEGVFEKFRR
jgi:predicted TIM-barrel fold metal-dependent hydrolase